jgi:hypothetical protein
MKDSGYGDLARVSRFDGYGPVLVVNGNHGVLANFEMHVLADAGAENHACQSHYDYKSCGNLTGKHAFSPHYCSP